MSYKQNKCFGLHLIRVVTQSFFGAKKLVKCTVNFFTWGKNWPVELTSLSSLLIWNLVLNCLFLSLSWT